MKARLKTMLVMTRFWLLLAIGACSFPPPDNVASVHGEVHGLWDGTEGVVLRLQGGGVDTQLTVRSNGSFSFPEPLREGAAYTVEVSANPAKHACQVERPRGPTSVDDTNEISVSISCTGPEISIALSGQWGWTFDPSQDSQTFSGSIAVQDAALTINGPSLVGVNVGDTAATVGVQTKPFPLPLGSLSVPVEVMESGGLSKSYTLIFVRGGKLLDQVVYGKASNTETGDEFGAAIALDGNTLAVAAPREDSITSQIDGDQSNNLARDSGAVYVFIRNGTTWSQQAYIKASNANTGDEFGTSIALSGNTLAVSAPGEDSGFRDNQTDNNTSDAGAVYIFTRSDFRWTQQAYIKESTPGIGHAFGSRLALFADTLAVTGNQVDSSQGLNSAVHVFVRTAATWSAQQTLTSSNLPGGLYFGAFIHYLGIALSGDTLVVPAIEVRASDLSLGRGGVFVFARNGTNWTQQGYLTVGKEGRRDRFGHSLAIFENTLAVGAPLEGPSDMSGAATGLVHVFTRTEATWTKQAQVTGSNTTRSYDQFGATVALSGDRLAVGAYGEAINGSSGGAVYVFARTGAAWSEHAYVKGSNTGADDRFGISVALSGDALAVGAAGEASRATGINPEDAQNDESEVSSGALYIFR